jgi:protocatechuate 3,4-dioxygenase beta subunit
MAIVKLSVSRLAISLVIAGLTALTPSLSAQSAGTGALTGTVRDPSGASIPGATVTLVSTGTNQTRTSTTGEDGGYKFALLPPGTYRVRFGAVGFKTAEVDYCQCDRDSGT